MSERTWTPGPWYVATFNEHTTVEAEAYTVAIEISNADAHLIATAPDLYEALLEALRELEGYDQDIGGEGYNNPRINAVLAKARGENPDE